MPASAAAPGTPESSVLTPVGRRLSVHSDAQVETPCCLHSDDVPRSLSTDSPVRPSDLPPASRSIFTFRITRRQTLPKTSAATCCVETDHRCHFSFFITQITLLAYTYRPTSHYSRRECNLERHCAPLEVATPTRRSFSGRGYNALTGRSHGHRLAAYLSRHLRQTVLLPMHCLACTYRVRARR